MFDINRYFQQRILSMTGYSWQGDNSSRMQSIASIKEHVTFTLNYLLNESQRRFGTYYVFSILFCAVTISVLIWIGHRMTCCPLGFVRFRIEDFRIEEQFIQFWITKFFVGMNEMLQNNKMSSETQKFPSIYLFLFVTCYMAFRVIWMTSSRVSANSVGNISATSEFNEVS